MVRDSRRTRRRQFVKALGVGGSVLLAGCTGGSGDGGSSDGSGGSSDGGSSGDSSDGGSSGGDGSGDSSGGGSATQAKFVHISSFGGDAQNVVPAFNDQAEGVTIEATGTPSESTTTRNYYVNQFVSQSSDFDVGMMDVIWPAEFVANGWAAEVSDPEGHTENMLSTPVEAATIDGTLYGMPMFTDANALYYRSDKLEEYGYDGPPETYMELVSIAQDVLEQDDEITNGYIWQGGANEGLTIMWLNWLWGMGGSVRQDGQLKVNTQKGIDALQHAVDLIHEHEVTPESIPASGTDGNRQTFQQGGTLFMRNWPYAVSLFQDDTPVTGKFDVAKMPKAEGNPDANNSCLGGWSIFVNAFSENKEAAQQFATYMASMEAQETLALEGSRLPVREELYADEYFEQAPNLETFAEVLQETRARPATPKYPTFSEIVYTEANKALVQSKTPEKALNDAQSQIDSQVNNA